MKKLGSSVLAIGATLCALVANPAAALAQGTCQVSFTSGSTSMACQTSLSEAATGVASFQIQSQVKVTATYINGQDGATGTLLNGQGTITCATNKITVIGQSQEKTCNTNGTNKFMIVVN